MSSAATANQTYSNVISNDHSGILIHKENLSGHYSKVQNWLTYKISHAKTALERRSWALLQFILSQDPYKPNPDIELTPEGIAAHFGVSKRTAYSWFNFLRRQGHIAIIKIREEKLGYVLGTEYHFYQNRFSWRKTTCNYLQVVKTKRKKRNSIKPDFLETAPAMDLQGPATCTNLQVVENLASADASYYKNTPARAHDNKTINKTIKTTTEPAAATAELPPEIKPEPVVVVSLANNEKAAELKNKIDPKRKTSVSLQLLIKLMIAYSIAQIEGLIDKINGNPSIQNVGGYLAKCLKEQWVLDDPADEAKRVEMEKIRIAEERKTQLRLTEEAKIQKEIKIIGFAQGAAQMREHIGLKSKQTKSISEKEKQQRIEVLRLQSIF